MYSQRKDQYYHVLRICREIRDVTQYISRSYFLGNKILCNIIHNSTTSKLHTCIVKIQLAILTCALMAVKLTLNKKSPGVNTPFPIAFPEVQSG